MKSFILAFVWLIFATFCQGQEAHEISNSEIVNCITNRSPVKGRIKMVKWSSGPREQHLGNGFSITSPGIVYKGKPIEWSIGITNQFSFPVHLIVRTTARWRYYNGVEIANLYNNITTNLLAPGESGVMSYKVDHWVPKGGDIRFTADITNLETKKHISGKIDGYYITSTNNFRIRDNPALIQEMLRAASNNTLSLKDKTNAPMKVMPLADGCYFTVPSRVSIFQPIEWSVFSTNTTAKTLRLDVCSSVDAKYDYGRPYKRLAAVISTNNIAPGESRLLPFSVAENWYPTNPPPFDCVEFSINIINRTDTNFNWNLLDVDVAECTNSIPTESQLSPGL